MSMVRLLRAIRKNPVGAKSIDLILRARFLFRTHPAGQFVYYAPILLWTNLLWEANRILGGGRGGKRLNIRFVFPKTGVAPRYYLSAMLRAKNEGPYLAEWICHHRAIGVEHFYIYDNGSTDNTDEVLAPFVEAGLVTHVKWPESPITPKGDVHFVETYGHESRWVAYIDADEFLIPQEGDSLLPILRARESVPGLGVASVNFGSSFHEKRQPGLLTENFLRRSGDPAVLTKTIFQPARAICYGNSHFYYYRWATARMMDGTRVTGPVSVKEVRDEVVLHHYLFKSREEYMVRALGKYAVDAMGLMRAQRTEELAASQFSRNNDMEDCSALRFVPGTKRVMSEFMVGGKV